MNNAYFFNSFKKIQKSIILRSNLVSSNNFLIPLLGFVPIEKNYIELPKKLELTTLSHDLKIDKTSFPIIDIHNVNHKNLPNNFIWFYQNSFLLQIDNTFQRDINNSLYILNYENKPFIKNIFKIN